MSSGTPEPQPASLYHIPRTNDIDLLLGLLVSSSADVPLMQRYDVAVRLRAFVPSYVYAALVSLAESVGGREALEGAASGTPPDDLRAQRRAGLVTGVILDVYGQIVDNIQALRREVPEYGFGEPPVVAVGANVSLLDLIRGVSKAISNYYRAETGRFLEKKDVKGFVYGSASLAVAILEPLRTTLSTLGC